MYKRIIAFLLLIFSTLFIAGRALAQSYSFSLPTETVKAIWNADGTLSIDYVFVFKNDPGAHPIDYVDVGIPNGNYDISTIYADVNGQPVSDISSSGYQGTGIGVAVGLGVYTIQAGETGTVHVLIGKVSGMLYPDTQDNTYASADFSPTYFGSAYASGSTDMTVIFQLPPGVKPEEPRYHASPSGGWPQAPESSVDTNGLVIYTWHNASASPSQQYLFGASFPAHYVPDSAIVRPSPFAFIGTFLASIAGCLIPIGVIGFFALVIGLSIYGDQKRKMSYLPPRIAIEGHGIKRGLTAVEAAILMEQPMDKIMTMILFALLKKNAAQVKTRDPLEIEAISPQPEGLFDYEKDFLQAFSEKGPQRQKALQDTMVKLIKSVSEKMRGFSARETVAYYKDITQQAWKQVEAAATPEVKSQKYDEVMEWTMLDKDYHDRTRNVFGGGPVFVPIWWGRYDPGFSRTSAAPVSTPASIGRPSGGGVSMPQLPGADFAASIVGGVQNFSSKVIGNVTNFTQGVSKVTNPPPPPSTSTYHGGGGGGHSCACACACAGCACACAGGGR